jgi:hypothetical protein
LNGFKNKIIKEREHRVEEVLNRAIRKPIEPCHPVFSGYPREHFLNLSIKVLSDSRESAEGYFRDERIPAPAPAPSHSFGDNCLHLMISTIAMEVKIII